MSKKDHKCKCVCAEYDGSESVPKTISWKQAKLAVMTAMSWGENAGLAFAESIDEDVSGRVALERPISAGMGGGDLVTADFITALLLAESQRELSERRVGMSSASGLFTHFDMRTED